LAAQLRGEEDLGHAAVRDAPNDVVAAVLRHPRGWNFTTLHDPLSVSGQWRDGARRVSVADLFGKNSMIRVGSRRALLAAYHRGRVWDARGTSQRSCDAPTARQPPSQGSHKK